jgi:hypothetical protein
MEPSKENTYSITGDFTMSRRPIKARYVMLCREPRKKGNWRTTFEVAAEYFYSPVKLTVPAIGVLRHTWYANFGYSGGIPSGNPDVLWKALQEKGFYFKFIRISRIDVMSCRSKIV